jgi:hypothetical protein
MDRALRRRHPNIHIPIAFDLRRSVIAECVMNHGKDALFREGPYDPVGARETRDQAHTTFAELLPRCNHPGRYSDHPVCKSSEGCGRNTVRRCENGKRRTLLELKHTIDHENIRARKIDRGLARWTNDDVGNSIERARANERFIADVSERIIHTNDPRILGLRTIRVADQRDARAIARK